MLAQRTKPAALVVWSPFSESRQVTLTVTVRSPWSGTSFAETVQLRVNGPLLVPSASASLHR